MSDELSHAERWVFVHDFALAATAASLFVLLCNYW